MRRFVPRAIVCRALVVLLLAGCSGCMSGSSLGGWAYVLSAGLGEVDYLSRAVPIEWGLNDPDLTDEEREKLDLVIRARDYAEQVVGLNVGDSFHRFVNLHGKALAWNLSASRKDALEPHYWQLPIAGSLPYLGFFEYEAAVAQRDLLIGEGLDTVLYEVDAFSTLGLLPDPVSSSLLKRKKYGLADTVMHELLHNTVYKAGDTTFSESLATFVGRTAGMEFLEAEFGPDSPLREEAHKAYEDSDRLNGFLRELRDDLEAFYASDRTSEEKIAGREEIFQAGRERFTAEVLPLMNNQEGFAVYGTLNYNNAFLLVNVRYNSDLHVYEEAFEKAGRDWAIALNVLSQAAATANPTRFLRDYAAME